MNLIENLCANVVALQSAMKRSFGQDTGGGTVYLHEARTNLADDWSLLLDFTARLCQV